jgi:hypothetical protein
MTETINVTTAAKYSFLTAGIEDMLSEMDQGKGRFRSPDPENM